MLQRREELRELVERYDVGAPDDTAAHNYRDFVCAVHCTCNDHYYRLRDCKHINAFLELYDAAAVPAGTEQAADYIPRGFRR